MILRFLHALAAASLIILTAETPARAESFAMPSAGDDLIGALRHTKPRHEDTLIDIARRFSVGQDEMVMANQAVDRWLPKAGTDVLIPQEFILPDAPRSGIVVNIPEMRLYYFPIQARPKPVKKIAAAPKSARPKPCVAAPSKEEGRKGTEIKGPKPKPSAPAPSKSGKPSAAPSSKPQGKATSQVKPQKSPAPTVSKTTVKPKITCQPAPVREEPKAVVAETDAFDPAPGGEVITYPVSMGRMDWRTPLGMTRVINKQKDPSWTPPASIKREHAAKGDPLPDVVPPGPDNPLGKYAMRLGVQGYLIHGTDAAKADGIGMRVTHGCMRMYNEDVAKLFPLVPIGAPVYLVNQPVKLGWKNGLLYMEVSQPLDEDVGIQGHDPDENVTKAQLDAEDEQRARFLFRVANKAIEKLREKGDVTVSLDKVRKAVHRPTGIPVVIGGHVGDSSWEAAAQSSDGLAPDAKPREMAEPDVETETDTRAISPPRPSVSSRSMERLNSFEDPSPEAAPVRDQEVEPMDPVRAPQRTWPTGPSASPPRNVRPSADSSTSTGVKVMPYGEGSDTDEEE